MTVGVEHETRQESGFVMLALLAALLPILMLVGAHSVVMTSRNSRLMAEVSFEKAFLAGEAGIDEAIFKANNNILMDGVPFERDLGGGMRFKVVPKYLKTDGADNDGDGKTDELDEDVFELIITGYYKNTFRRFASYLGSNSPIPLMDSALYTDGVNSINLENLTFISGEDVMLDDSAGNPLYDVAGLAIKDPGTVAELSSALTLGGPQAEILGTGGDPSLAVSSSSFDLDALATRVEALATDTLVNPVYSNPTLGDSSSNDYRLIYRNGDLTLQGLSRGAGIMVVRGDLLLRNNFRFDGIIVVFGSVSIEQFSRIYGGIVQVPGLSGTFNLTNHSRVQYSYEVMEKIQATIPAENDSLGGWQEISRN